MKPKPRKLKRTCANCRNGEKVGEHTIWCRQWMFHPRSDWWCADWKSRKS